MVFSLNVCVQSHTFVQIIIFNLDIQGVITYPLSFSLSCRNRLSFIFDSHSSTL